MVVLGFALVALVLAVAVGIGVLANQRVRQFDESQHESFVGSRQS